MQKLIEQYQNKSMEVLKASKREYSKMKDVYNEGALAKYEKELINEAEKKLKAIKNDFIKKANALVDKKIQQNEAEQDKFNIKDNTEFLRFYTEAKLKFDILPLHQILNEMQNIENPIEFAVAKQTALSMADKQEKVDIYRMNYESPMAKDIRQDKLFIRELEMNVNQYVLPMYINVREYVTGISSSDYYFNSNNKTEDNFNMYFGSKK